MKLQEILEHPNFELKKTKITHDAWDAGEYIIIIGQHEDSLFIEHESGETDIWSLSSEKDEDFSLNAPTLTQEVTLYRRVIVISKEDSRWLVSGYYERKEDLIKATEKCYVAGPIEEVTLPVEIRENYT